MERSYRGESVFPCHFHVILVVGACSGIGRVAFHDVGMQTLHEGRDESRRNEKRGSGVPWQTGTYV